MKRNRLRWYQVLYRLLYRSGLVFWQRSAPPADLVALVEGPAALRPGRALELGCGTGTDTTYLATHGWDVTAVDMVPKALDVNLKETVVGLLAGRTAPYEVQINEIVATEVSADADRVNVRLQFDLRVR